MLIEDPTHPGLRSVITSAGCAVSPVPADQKGLQTAALNSQQKAAFIYTTPSHQYPLGGILPIQRRLKLLQFAREQNTYIAEDDYDSEFRYQGQPVSSMYELDPQRVIYLGSFSKILSPALRLGYMIIPPQLNESLTRHKIYSDVHTDSLSQYALADFLDNGGFEKHIWKMKKYYRRQREILLKTLAEFFPGEHEVLGDASGLHLVVNFANIRFTKSAVKKLSDNRVKVYPLSSFYLHEQEAGNCLVMGYAHLEPDQIRNGIAVIRQSLAQ